MKLAPRAGTAPRDGAAGNSLSHQRQWTAPPGAAHSFTTGARDKMGIKMNPPEFPEDRLNDKRLRGAEARVFNALRNSKMDGHGIYEFRYREGGRQLDKAVWGNYVGRFAIQVKGGKYEMDAEGQLSLIRPDGTRKEVRCPLQATEDGCIEMKHAILEATGYTHFVVGVIIFPDMERDARMEEVALRKNHVYIIWGLDHLQEDLERIARKAEVKHPPKPSHSENECRKVNEFQYRGPEVSQDDGEETPAAEAATPPPAPGSLDLGLKLGSVTINIQHVETLVIQYGPPERDVEGQTVMRGL